MLGFRHSRVDPTSARVIQPRSEGLQPTSNGLQPGSAGLPFDVQIATRKRLVDTCVTSLASQLVASFVNMFVCTDFETVLFSFTY